MERSELLVSPRPAAPAKRKRGALALARKNAAVYLFLLPTFTFLAVFTFYPIVSAFWHSFYRWDGVNSEYVGLENFVQMFTVDRAFAASLANVLKLTLFRVAVALTVPLLAAEVIFSLRNAGVAYFWRVLLVVPMVVPWVVLILVWLFIYDPQMGILNTVLTGIGLEEWRQLWLGDLRIALWCIGFFGFPWISGLNLLIYLAGLDAIPHELFDAAAIDGATRIRRFFHLDVPMIMGQIKLIFILTLITQLQNFQDVLIFTNGGPGQATMMPGLVLYHSAFFYNKMGYASAIGVLLFVIIFAITLLNMRLIRSDLEYKPGE
jgi:raffinose/stachyose/melibiose transport system permease protein